MNNSNRHTIPGPFPRLRKKTANDNIPVAVALLIDNIHGSMVPGSGYRSCRVTDPHTSLGIGMLQSDIPTELSYEHPMEDLPLFGKHIVKHKYIYCAIVPNNTNPIVKGSTVGKSLGVTGCVDSMTDADNSVGSSMTSFRGRYVVLYGYIPKGTVYCKVENNLLKAMPKVVSEKVVIFDYNTQMCINRLTSNSNIKSLCHSTN